MKRFLIILIKCTVLWMGIFAVIIKCQANAYEWTIKTTQDALSEKDIKKIHRWEIHNVGRNTKKRLKVLINALKICIKDRPKEMIIDVIPTVEEHALRKVDGDPVEIFSQIVCISSDVIKAPEYLENTYDLDSIEKLKLDQLPKDLFGAISKNLSAIDVVNLSKVNKAIHSKVLNIPKKMMFSICLKYFGDNSIINIFSHISKFHQNINLSHFRSSDPKVINSLPKNINRLSFTNYNSQLILHILKSMDPVHFNSLQELGGDCRFKRIPINYFLKFPNLIGLGTFNAPITLSREDFILLPKLIGDRLRSLNIGYIQNTNEEIIDTINNLPCLRTLYFSIGDEAQNLTEQDIIRLNKMPLLESLKMEAYESIRIENAQDFMLFMRKIPNLKIFWISEKMFFNEGIDFMFWSRLEKLGLSLANDHKFWKEVLPKMNQLKVLSINLPNDKESWGILANLPKLEKLHFRGKFTEKVLEDIAHSLLKITELSIDTSYFVEDAITFNKNLFNILLQFPHLKIFHLENCQGYFAECRKIISLISRGRIQLVKDRPSFFEDPLD